MVETSRRPGLEIVSAATGSLTGTRPRRKASEAVAQRIVDQLVAQGLGAGARLPSEAEMVAEFGVSRETLREGLRLLEVQGLISIRRGPGGGPMVEAVNAGALARTTALYLHLAGATYGEVLEAWQLMEPSLASQAAGNPDRARVRRELAPFLEVHSGPPLELSVDESLHEVIATLAGNRVTHLLTRSVAHLVVDQVFTSLADVEISPERVNAEHREIATAIVRGHRRQAWELTDAHIGATVELFRNAAADRMDDVIAWW